MVTACHDLFHRGPTGSLVLSGRCEQLMRALTKPAPRIIACRPGLHGLQFGKLTSVEKTVGSTDQMISGSLQIKSRHAQGYLFLKTNIFDFGKPSSRTRACSRMCFLSGKMIP